MISHRPTESPHQDRRDLHNLRILLPHLRQYRGRVLLALATLILAKVANVGIPVLLKDIVDHLDSDTALVLPIALLAGYGALRLAASLFNELRDALFARVRYAAMRSIGSQALQHLHSLSLRFHLERQTGAIARDLERGTQSVSSLLNYLIFQIIPVAVEFLLVGIILFHHFDAQYALIIFTAIALYIGFTVKVTHWRMHWRHEMNAHDSKANNRALDSLINFETVKYFNNESHEVRRYNDTLKDWEHAAVQSQVSMSALNFGQGAIIALSVTAIMIMATNQVVQGQLSIGELVMINTLMLQLFIPLNFLGVVYRSIKYALADMDRLFKLIETQPDIKDSPQAHPLKIQQADIRFNNIHFAYQPQRPILQGIDLHLPAGQKIAIVGPSGAGKSTLARLLYRLYEPDQGHILIDGQDIQNVTQASLRQAIGIVPQDTVLFNDSLYYNLQYARPDADRHAIEQAAKLAKLHHFIQTLPDGYNTLVGERGLKLSGGEKQRLAIARALLKNPRILIFDEATSSLDSRSEKAILDALRDIAENHSTLVIAHRLSTIIDADQILVLDQGRIKEQGQHQQLLAQNGLYAHLWTLQQQKAADA